MIVVGSTNSSNSKRLVEVALEYGARASYLVDRADGDYGEGRLRRRLRDVGHGRTARGIRDALLLDLWNFKGDAEQRDDVTAVVVRIPT